MVRIVDGEEERIEGTSDWRVVTADDEKEGAGEIIGWMVG